MEEQGIGISKEEFYLRKEGKGSGHLSGHVGFAESVGMIADGIGWDLDDFKQDMEPIVTDVDRKSPYGFAAAGSVAGVASIYSHLEEIGGVKVVSLFNTGDLPGYASHSPEECPLCKQGLEVDAVVDKFGYSAL